MKTIFYTFTLAALLFGFSTNCSMESPKDSNDSRKLLLLYLSTFPNPDSSEVYFSSVRNLNLEVVYETGATPEVGNLVVGDPVWDITKDNLEAPYENRDYTVSVSVPTELTGMREISSNGQATWTLAEIMALSAAYKTQHSDYENAKFFLAYVNGYLDNNGVANTSVIGVNISGTPITVVFKDVIENSFSGIQKKYAEQIVVSHELGHALGMVNKGVPMVSSHQDTANGNHCTNTTCGMYYAIGGSSGTSTFITNVFSEGSLVIYGNECLNDFYNYTP